MVVTAVILSAEDLNEHTLLAPDMTEIFRHYELILMQKSFEI